ncbi:EpsG family protein [Cedecea neteri]|uniref:EpsG family protein n=1 Tax=Cedecea neteri TaxID=158822 RepID=UPI0008FFC4E6|nr:EpsG family protein [Cedecea neteri]
MLFYILAGFLAFFCVLEISLKIMNVGSWTYVKIKNDLYLKLFFFLFFLLLIIFCGLRAEGVDRDYPEYLNMLSQVPPFPVVLFSDLSNVHGDPIFYFIASLINLIDGEPYLLFLCFSLLSLSLYRWCFIKYSPLPFLSLLIYFCHSFLNKEMTQIRNGLSSALLLVMLCYLSERKNLKATAFLYFSFLAHSSGLVGILLYGSRLFSKKRNLFYCIGIFISLVLYFTWHQLFSLLPQNIGIVQKTYQYIMWDAYNYSLSLFNPILLKMIFYFVLFLYVKKIVGLSDKLDVFLFSYFLSICFYIAFNDTAILGARTASTLSCSEFILIPAIINRLIECKKMALAILVLITTVIISLALLYINLEVKDIFNDYRTVIFN